MNRKPSDLLPWNDEVWSFWERHYALFDIQRRQRWRTIYKKRLEGMQIKELASLFGTSPRIVRLNIATVERSLRLMARMQEEQNGQ